MNHPARTSVSIVLVLCVLSVGGLAQAQAAEHAGHHAQHQLADELGLNRVEFVGALRGLDKWAAYQAATLFVLPSHTENFAMTVAEALASGVPAIVSKGAP